MSPNFLHAVLFLPPCSIEVLNKQKQFGLINLIVFIT
jgi:hypothetical protein